VDALIADSEEVTVMFRRGRYNRRTGRHNPDKIIVMQKVPPKEIWISGFMRNGKPVKGHKRTLLKKKKSSKIIDLDARERERQRRRLYRQRLKNRSPKKKTTKRR